MTNMTNSAAIGGQLQDAKAGKPGALDLPDLFSAHSSDAKALGIETLVDWNDWFTAEEMAAYVPGFVQDGIIDGRQVVFPVSKSTQLIFLNGSQYARFAADTRAQLSTLATWDGFFAMAAAYRQWSQGKPFCALDYPLRLVELNALEQGSGALYKDSWYDLTNETFRASWMEFAQPTGFDRLICLLAPAGDGLNAGAALSSGTTDGYYHAPRDALALRSMGGRLTQLIGAGSAYAGITELCRLNENQAYRLAVCIPMADYQRLVFSGNLQMLLIGLFIAFFVVFCCIYFHRHILSPAFRQFEEDKRESRRRMDELQMERQQMQTELSRLADVCRNESVPDAFQTFLAGIPTLTKTERRIFDGYVAGLRSREIVEQLDIKDSTLRFHNKNIYEKLGVSSLKQLQQFAAILNSGGNSVPDDGAPGKGC